MESEGFGVKTTGDILDDRRIWVGNLDPRLSEYQLLKIVQKCGKIEKFDMLFHKGGPLVGQSRGYAFVTFSSPDSAINALEKLNGSVVSNRPVAVRLAKNVSYEDLEKPRPRLDIPALGTGQREGKISKQEAIRAIEHKLKMLERQKSDDLDFSSSSTSSSAPQTSLIQRYQFNKNREASTSKSISCRTFQRGTTKHPYSRSQRPKRR